MRAHGTQGLRDGLLVLIPTAGLAHATHSGQLQWESFLRESLRRDLAITLLHFDADRTMTEALRGDERGAAAHERVKHNISWFSPPVHEPLDVLQFSRTRMIGLLAFRIRVNHFAWNNMRATT